MLEGHRELHLDECSFAAARPPAPPKAADDTGATDDGDAEDGAPQTWETRRRKSPATPAKDFDLETPAGADESCSWTTVTSLVVTAPPPYTPRHSSLSTGAYELQLDKPYERYVALELLDLAR